MEYLKRPENETSGGSAVTERVEKIVSDVRDRGDPAIRELTAKFDEVERESPRLSDTERETALSGLSEEEQAIIDHNHERIRAFARQQLDSIEEFEETFGDGIRIGQTVRPIPSMGAYVPGGRYPLLSSALMTLTPAAVAGVEELILTTPPATDAGRPHAATVYAADLVGVDEIFVAGGAQAVAAMAYGTSEVPAVDKIVGPGNAYTTEAKRQVYGEVGIDLLAGPSEILVLADESADPEVVACDLLAQAEHDPDARPLLVSSDRELAEATIDAVEEQLATLGTEDIARESWENEGTVVVTQDIEGAVGATNEFAPEHLEVHTAEPRNLMDDLVNYGSLFLGEESAVVYSDKCVGTNHVLPTRTGARHTGGLSVFDCVKILTHQELTQEGVETVRRWSTSQAQHERLEGHAKSAYIRGPDATLDDYDRNPPSFDLESQE